LRNVSDKIVNKSHFVFSIFFPKIVPLMR